MSSASASSAAASSSHSQSLISVDVVHRAGAGHDLAVGAQAEDGGALEHHGEPLGHLGQPAAGERDLHELVVHAGGQRQRLALLGDDGAEDLGHDLVQPDAGRQREHRQPAPVRLGEHLTGHRRGPLGRGGRPGRRCPSSPAARRGHGSCAGSAGGSRAPSTTRTSGPAAASGSAGSSTTMCRTTRPRPAAPAATVVPASPGSWRASSTVRPMRSCQLVRSSRVVSARDSSTAQLRRNGTEPLRCVEATSEASPWVTTYPPHCHRPGCHTPGSCQESPDDDTHSWRLPP